jgi:hypothetical protein
MVFLPITWALRCLIDLIMINCNRGTTVFFLSYHTRQAKGMPLASWSCRNVLSSVRCTCTNVLPTNKDTLTTGLTARMYVQVLSPSMTFANLHGTYLT